MPAYFRSPQMLAQAARHRWNSRIRARVAHSPFNRLPNILFQLADFTPRAAHLAARSPGWLLKRTGRSQIATGLRYRTSKAA